MAVVGSQKIRPVRVVVGVGVRHGLAGDYFAAEVEIRGHAAQVAGRVVVVVELQPVVGGRFRVFLLRQLCTGKHRLLGKQKAMPAGMMYTHSPLHGRLIERLIPHMILDRTPSKP